MKQLYSATAATFVILAFFLAGCSSPPEADLGDSADLDLLAGTILLTDDDGWDAPGIQVLREVLQAEGYDVVLVAPLENQSGSSGSLTPASTLAVTQPTKSDDTYAVDGTPADSVLVALTGVLESPPSLVISGINLGYNIGDDLNYSGTVGAAIVASLQGIPSIAVSATSPPAGSDPSEQYRVVARFIGKLLVALDKSDTDSWPGGTVLNVNYPVGNASPAGGVSFTTVADARSMAADYDPAGDGNYERRYVADDPAAAGTDIAVVNQGDISVSAVSSNRGSKSSDHTKLRSLLATLEP